MVAEKSKILVIGGTDYLGKHIVEASAKAGHPTFALVSPYALCDPAKAAIIDNFKNLGVTLVHGDIYDHESLVKAIKQVDVVISSVGFIQLEDQVKIIAAIKEAGNIKRFFPSEFGNDVDRTSAVEPARSTFKTKAQIRRATTHARDKVIILCDGNVKGVFNQEEDIAMYTIKAVDDPRTLNKILYIRPPANTYSSNELVELWEKSIGKTFEKIYVPEEEILKQIQGDVQLYPPPNTNKENKKEKLKLIHKIAIAGACLFILVALIVGLIYLENRKFHSQRLRSSIASCSCMRDHGSVDSQQEWEIDTGNNKNSKGNQKTGNVRAANRAAGSPPAVDLPRNGRFVINTGGNTNHGDVQESGSVDFANIG